MFRSLWKSLVSPEPHPGHKHVAINRDKLKMLVENFPVGRRLRYTPEYQHDIVFDTILVGYSVNDHFIYSRDAVRLDDDDVPVAFSFGPGKPALPADRVRSLYLMVPDTSDMERSLDYNRRAALGRTGQFTQGNAITLIADSGQRGVPTVDTQVEKRLKLADGPYAEHRMILLDPDFSSLAITDQRRKPRQRTEIPADLYLQEGAPASRCMVADFSDLTVRLRSRDSQEPMPAMQPRDEVTVVIDLGEMAKTYLVRGSVFRSTEADAVIELKQLYRDGDFAPFKLMEALEIKAGLLNYGC
ncbi:MAG TPA: hypothetical protein VMB75_09165 [Rhodocyclaceae bacterium]|nr:hypothetical protein [Rhodocyclaceae bacterium]